jgi:LmbE family N-acetylglucosaminyl deacetylase
VPVRTILGVFAHPDDESMGPGGTLARYAAAGHRCLVATATAGDAGRHFADRPEHDGGRKRLAAIREQETVRACEILGVTHLGFWGWKDGRLSDHDVLEVEQRIVAILRRERPDVVITFHGSGISFHPDHRVITLATMGAFLGSGRPEWYASGEGAPLPPHAPAKLYGYTVDGAAGFRVDWPRHTYGSPPEEITTVIDTREWADVRWKAIEAHESQRDGPPFWKLYEAGAFETECYVRIFPSPRAGEPRETDLLANLDSC